MCLRVCICCKIGNQLPLISFEKPRSALWKKQQKNENEVKWNVDIRKTNNDKHLTNGIK
jgi:hypothetical protein